MTATMNTGAETVRVAGDYLPVLLQLKTTGAIGVDRATTAAKARLEAGELIVDGNLHPMVDAMLDIVAAPGLVVSVERMRLGSVAASTIWANAVGAVIGSRVEGGLFELKLAGTELLPFHLFQLVHLRPLPLGSTKPITMSAAAMFDAEGAIHKGDWVAARDVLAVAGLTPDVAQRVIDALEKRVASWRIHSTWSTAAGVQVAEAFGMDCGRDGHLLIAVEHDTNVTLRSASFKEVVATLRAMLPAAG